MRYILLVLFSVVILQSCSGSQAIDKGIKSPCVAIESQTGQADNPCGQRRPANKWLS
jgi:hypothetical protein